MKKYHNYSPEISASDETFEQESQEQTADNEPRRRGRNRSSNQQPASNASTSRPTPSAPTGLSSADSQGKPKENFIDKIKAIRDSVATRLVIGIILGGFGVWLGVAFVSYFTSCIADQSVVDSIATGPGVEVANDAGEGGARLTEFLINQGFGVGAIVLVIWLLCMSLKLLVGLPKFRTLDFTIKSLIAFITLSVVVGMLCIGLDTDVNWGGFHGRYINEFIYSYIGWSGAIILSVVLISIFVVICLRDVIKWIIKKKRQYDQKRQMHRAAEAEKLRQEEEQRERERKSDLADSLYSENENLEEKKEESHIAANVEFNNESDTIFDLPDLEEEEEPYSRFDNIQDDPDSLAISEDLLENYVDLEKIAESGITEVKEETEEETEEENTTEETTDFHNDTSSSESEEPEIKAIEEETKNANRGAEVSEDPMTVNINHIATNDIEPAATYDETLFTHEYVFPTVDYLLPGTDKISVDANELLENKEKIKKTLLDFGIPIVSIQATVGPTVTLYEIRPDSGIKIAKIRNLVDDLALSLAANGVRIIAPIPGKGTVGIEVANRVKQTVSMRTIIQSKAYQTSKFKLPVALGSTISNEVYIADLAKMPHLLVAGATGQGKSVGLNAIVTSLLYSKRPEELKFVMVDPKRVEFSLYSKIEKYYLAKIPDSPQAIITNMENVVATLSSLCVEMDERYVLLEKAYVKQVTEYNEKFREKKLDPREGHRYMPYIVVIIDEFADLIMNAGKEVEQSIARLAQLARAVGIHVIIATQRPSTNVITGMIKANFPVRIAFKVTSGIDSKTILDSTGAQHLIGRGDMLISNNGEMTRVQCAFVDTPEVENICDYIARQPYPQGAYMLPEPQINGESNAQEKEATTADKLDPLFAEVGRQVIMTGSASTSAIQRRYEIGYNRAGRIMDQLEAYGVVGPATGGKPRSVLMDAMSFEALLATLGLA